MAIALGVLLVLAIDFALAWCLVRVLPRPFGRELPGGLPATGAAGNFAASPTEEDPQ